MPATCGGGANSKERARPRRGGRTVVAASQIIDRRSPHRPKFSAGWRKTIVSDPARFAVAVAEEPDCVDVWTAHPAALLRAHSCLKLLTDEDWSSFRKIRDSAMRQSATAARILLRLALSKAIDRKIEPFDWRFEVSEHGKAIVARHFPRVNFSVAHVDELSVVAVSRSLEIGIDVESVDQNASEALMAGYCHHEEWNAVRDLPQLQKAREFLRYWTLKESYTKLIGLGHSVDFDTIRFVLDPPGLGRESDAAGTRVLPQFETFYIPVGHGLYHLALAIRGAGQRAVATELKITILAEPKPASQTARGASHNRYEG
jgi:phosphopantetheinyl transferase